MKIKQMTRKVKLAILGSLLIVVVSVAFAIAVSTGLLGGTIDNSGELLPGGAVGSPLVVIKHSSMWNGSVGGEHNDPSQFVIVDKIKWATLYGAGSNANSFEALNKSAISLWNNSTGILYPAWTVIGLPTGYTLTCYVAVSIPEMTTDPTWSGGYFWSQNDYMAFTLRPQDFNDANYYRMVFVLSALATAIPGPMNFQIQFVYSTTPS
jgi:hypothetical protein